MSIERCEKHNWQWDSDFVQSCPQCDWADNEPSAERASVEDELNKESEDA